MHKDKAFEIPTPDHAADFYELTHNLMNEARMPAYEVSNHAKEGYECEHNMVYWRYDDYIGIGPGAHGRYTYMNQKFATVKQHNPQSWLKLVGSTGVGLQKIDELDNEDERIEKVLMGIRTNEGVLTSIVKKDVQHLLDSGLLQKIGDRFVASFKGIMLLNKLTEELI
jgi:coproporphyrinogen III oxidase-like Fe-S oxidoreductase